MPAASFPLLQMVATNKESHSYVLCQEGSLAINKLQEGHCVSRTFGSAKGENKIERTNAD